MTKADIYEIILKIVGIYLLYTVIQGIGGAFLVFLLLSPNNSTSALVDNFRGAPLLLLLLGWSIIKLIASFYFIFRPKAIVRRLTKYSDNQESQHNANQDY
jgi:hypothetical protein